MPKIYPLQQKRHALYLLDELDSVAAVSAETGIPERTLREWSAQRQRGIIFPRKNPATAYAGKPGSLDLKELRDRLLEQVNKLTETLTDDPHRAYITSLAVQRYLRQVRELNDALGFDPPPHLTDIDDEVEVPD